MEKTKTGIELITEERQRQIEVEEWDAKHDDRHNDSELAKAACVYAAPFPSASFIDYNWPFEKYWYKPSGLIFREDKSETYDGRIRELQKAGALIAAEIDRIQRLKDKQ